jgi:hypothetical protein
MNTAQTTDTTVAQTILAQLGANRFLAMTGAKDLMSRPRGVQFKLPARFARDGINCVTITLLPSDTYHVNFLKLGRAPLFNATLVSESTDVYADSLRDVFTSATGLAVSL